MCVVLSCGDRALCAWSYPVGTGLYVRGPTSWEQGSMCAVLPCGDRALCAWSYLVVTGLFVRGPILWGQGSMHVVLPRGDRVLCVWPHLVGTGLYVCGPTLWSLWGNTSTLFIHRWPAAEQNREEKKHPGLRFRCYRIKRTGDHKMVASCSVDCLNSN